MRERVSSLRPSHRLQGDRADVAGGDLRRHSRASRGRSSGRRLAPDSIGFSSSVVLSSRDDMRQMAGRIGTDGLPSAPALRRLPAIAGPMPLRAGHRDSLIGAFRIADASFERDPSCPYGVRAPARDVRDTSSLERCGFRAVGRCPSSGRSCTLLRRPSHGSRSETCVSDHPQAGACRIKRLLITAPSPAARASRAASARSAPRRARRGGRASGRRTGRRDRNRTARPPAPGSAPTWRTRPCA